MGGLIMLKECFANGIVPFVLTDEAKLFYYRDLSEWDSERGFLLETCRGAQDAFAEWLKCFRVG